jgi:hypothetical protein
MTEGRFAWSFGDGGSADLFSNMPLSHIYYYSGTYQVVLRYYSSAIKSDPDYLFKKSIKIIPASISIAGTTDDGGLVVQNNSTGDIDLGGWAISNQGSRFVFPENTIAGQGSAISVSGNTLGFKIKGTGGIQLSNPSGVVIATGVGAPQAHPHIKSSDSSNQVPEVSEDSDWSGLSSPPAQASSANPSPAESSSKPPLHRLFSPYLWVFLSILFILIILVAYTAFRRYDDKNNLDSVTEQELDELL